MIATDQECDGQVEPGESTIVWTSNEHTKPNYSNVPYDILCQGASGDSNMLATGPNPGLLVPTYDSYMNENLAQLGNLCPRSSAGTYCSPQLYTVFNNLQSSPESAVNSVQRFYESDPSLIEIEQRNVQSSELYPASNSVHLSENYYEQPEETGLPILSQCHFDTRFGIATGSENPSVAMDSSVQHLANSKSKRQLPYAKLLFTALSRSPDHSMALRDIYKWFDDNTDKTKEKESRGWQNSIRHNLSMNAVSSSIMFSEITLIREGFRKNPKVITTAR